MSGRTGKLFSDIRFWIVFFFLLRMYGITNPPLETGHSWRQVTGTMVARNFLEVDNNILYPRIDDNQGVSGIVGMEFPLLNYMVYLVSLVFGYTHWYGRLINLLITSLGAWYFFRLLSDWFGSRAAFCSTLLLLGSIWFAFSRKTMPDTFCVALMIIALYYGLKYLYEGKLLHLFLFTGVGSAAVLAKIPAIYLLAVFALPAFDGRVNLKNKLLAGTACLIICLIAGWWYFIWCPHLSETYGVWYNSGEPITKGIQSTLSHAAETAKRFYFDALCYSGFAVFLAGLYLVIAKKERTLLLVFLSCTAVFILYVFRSGNVFYHHNYYIIPYVPVMCMVGGYALATVKKDMIRNALLFLVLAEGILNQQHDFRIKDSERYKLELESIADKVSGRNELIVINASNNPQQIYFTHRKGWSVDNTLVKDSTFINDIRGQGCRYMFINRKQLNETLPYRKVFENDFYTVYRL